MSSTSSSLKRRDLFDASMLFPKEPSSACHAYKIYPVIWVRASVSKKRCFIFYCVSSYILCVGGHERLDAFRGKKRRTREQTRQTRRQKLLTIFSRSDLKRISRDCMSLPSLVMTLNSRLSPARDDTDSLLTDTSSYIWDVDTTLHYGILDSRHFFFTILIHIKKSGERITRKFW